jgi:hypothetical protein
VKDAALGLLEEDARFRAGVRKGLWGKRTADRLLKKKKWMLG